MERRQYRSKKREKIIVKHGRKRKRRRKRKRETEEGDEGKIQRW